MKVYDIEVFENERPASPDRRFMAWVRLHRKDDLACFAISQDRDDAVRRATALGERWQAKWDADQANREKRIEAARVARVKRAAKLAVAEATP